MDKKTGLPPSGSTMGNNALRIKNKLFAASTMTNLQPHSHRYSAQVSRAEHAIAAHIITSVLKMLGKVMRGKIDYTLISPIVGRNVSHSNGFPHDYVGITKCGGALKPRLLEHGHSS